MSAILCSIFYHTFSRIYMFCVKFYLGFSILFNLVLDTQMKLHCIVQDKSIGQESHKTPTSTSTYTAEFVDTLRELGFGKKDLEIEETALITSK